MLGREGLNIPISKPSFQRNWYSRGLTEKNLQTVKFVLQYRISHCKSPSIELFVLDIYYVFISIVQKFALLLYLTRCIIHHISIPCRSEAHRDGGQKANRSFAFSIILASVSFWPLLIIEPVARLSQHVLSRTNCSLSRYNAKGKLNCFNCKTGVFLRLFTPTFTKESNYNPRFFGKNQLLYGEYLTSIKKN